MCMKAALLQVSQLKGRCACCAVQGCSSRASWTWSSILHAMTAALPRSSPDPGWTLSCAGRQPPCWTRLQLRLHALQSEHPPPFTCAAPRKLTTMVGHDDTPLTPMHCWRKGNNTACLIWLCRGKLRGIGAADAARWARRFAEASFGDALFAAALALLLRPGMPEAAQVPPGHQIWFSAAQTWPAAEKSHVVGQHAVRGLFFCGTYSLCMHAGVQQVALLSVLGEEGALHLLPPLRSAPGGAGAYTGAHVPKPSQAVLRAYQELESLEALGKAAETGSLVHELAVFHKGQGGL